MVCLILLGLWAANAWAHRSVCRPITADDIAELAHHIGLPQVFDAMIRYDAAQGIGRLSMQTSFRPDPRICLCMFIGD